MCAFPSGPARAQTAYDVRREVILALPQHDREQLLQAVRGGPIVDDPKKIVARPLLSMENRYRGRATAAGEPPLLPEIVVRACGRARSAHRALTRSQKMMHGFGDAAAPDKFAALAINDFVFEW
jgi:hypothetical protein